MEADDAEGDLGLSPTLFTPLKKATRMADLSLRGDNIAGRGSSLSPLTGSRRTNRPPELQLGPEKDLVNLTPLRQIKTGMTASSSSVSLFDRTLPVDDTEATPVRPSSTRSASSNLSRSRTMPRMRTPSTDTSLPLTAPAGEYRLAPAPVAQSRLGEETVSGMQRWVEEIAVCNFDLDRGPVVDYRMAGRPWGKGEKDNVAFSSFPDTSLFAEGSISYSFKIRQATPVSPPAEMRSTETTPSPSTSYFATLQSSAPCDPATDDSIKQPPRTPSMQDTPRFRPASPQTPSAQKTLMTKGETADDYRKWDERGREWTYGFVWFEQRKDKNISRGYMQRSIVILTKLPLPSLFARVLSIVAPAYFSQGHTVLESVCHAIASWPDPTHGQILDLPILSEVVQVMMPHISEASQILPSPGSVLLASQPAEPPLRVFSRFLSSLWSIWECLMLGEPLLVITPDPKTCSDIVWALRDLMRPIPASKFDFRPYLHIHDLDFRLLFNANKPPAGVVVGVTNPFFRNAASHWPNIISLGSAGLSVRSIDKNDTLQGFISKRKRHVSKDRDLLARLEALIAKGASDDAAGNHALRTHFVQMTEKMLSPLNRYVTSLIPPPTSMESLRPFSLPDFLVHLKSTAPNPLRFRSKGLTLKGKVESDFYTSFCMSSAFAGWLEVRTDSLQAARASSRLAASAALMGSQTAKEGRESEDWSNRSSSSSFGKASSAGMSRRGSVGVSHLTMTDRQGGG